MTYHSLKHHSLKRHALATTAATALVLATSAAWAGEPHFVGDPCETVRRLGDTLTVDGKEAGLGNETQIHVEVSASAQCVNPGSNKPKAGNKQTVSAGEDVPVQNGKAIYSIDLTATFQPSCTPPMTVEFSNVRVFDTTNGLSVTCSGTF
jgi:hypothetical protein